MALGLSKFCLTTTLLEALNISPINELYYKFKYLFIRQLKSHWVAYSLYSEVNKFDIKKSRYNKFSFCAQIREMGSFILTDQDRIDSIDLFTLNRQEAQTRIKNKFRCDNQGLIDSVKAHCVFLTPVDLSSSFCGLSLAPELELRRLRRN